GGVEHGRGRGAVVATEADVAVAGDRGDGVRWREPDFKVLEVQSRPGSPRQRAALPGEEVADGPQPTFRHDVQGKTPSRNTWRVRHGERVEDGGGTSLSAPAGTRGPGGRRAFRRGRDVIGGRAWGSGRRGSRAGGR